jgi:serine/threonine protein kinase
MEESQIGNYRIIRKIGAGGMARVYLAAHQDVPNLKVVLKVLSDPRMADRFRQEADKLALLDGHPNICHIKHFFNHGDDFVIAMEYIDGITLDDKIRNEGKLPVGEAVQIVAAVLDILSAAHGIDIYHRDIKPSNIMIDTKGDIKIIDFGIAKSKSDPNLTVTGTSCGTPAYMAPEQFTPSESMDYAAIDIYATGTTLYYILTGQLPFKGENEFAIRDAKLFSEPTKPRHLNIEIPKGLETAILKALKKNPGDRYRSAQEMKDAIIPFLEERKDAGVTISDLSVAHKVPERRSRKFLIGAVAVVIAFVAGVTILKLLPLREHRAEQAIPAHDSSENTATVTEDTVITAAAPVPEEDLGGTGIISVSAVPAADFYLNGELIARNIHDTSIERDTGTYIIRVENQKAVNRVVFDTITLSRAENLRRSYSFQIREIAPRLGKVLVGSRPRGADIYIDDVLQQNKTPYTYSLKEGRHVIRISIERDGRTSDHVDTVTVAKDETSRAFFDFGE